MSGLRAAAARLPVRAWAGLLAVLACLAAAPACAQKKYGPGVSDSEIRIGQTMPYSGPASAYATIGKAEVAYFDMVNDQGGINGRRIRLLSLDDGYSPPRTLEQTRRLVEQDEVLMIFQSLGSPTNAAIQKYLHSKNVPHLFLAAGASRWADPKNFPLSMGLNPNYWAEARIYARHILATRPDAKLAVLYQNDDFGKDYLAGLESVLGDRAARMIAAKASYEVSDPTIDSQIVALRASGADTLLTFATPKFAAQAIRKVADIGWKPAAHYLSYTSASVGAVLKPAGLERSTGIVTAYFMKDVTDPRYDNDPGVKAYLAWLARYLKGADVNDAFNVYGYLAGQLLSHLLKACADDLTRENVMKQATSLRDVELPLLLPGIRINTSPTDYIPIGEMQLTRFDGQRWVPFGEVVSGR